MSARERPLLFVTGHAPADRVGAFATLHERENVLFALFGGRDTHAGEAATQLSFPHGHVSQRDVYALAASGDYRAVVAGTGGRLALPAAWRGSRRAQIPFLLWSSLWAHPRSAAHAASYLLLRRLYSQADAVVAYGSHVARYVTARGAHNVHIAPQAVDNRFWSQQAEPEPRPDGRFRALFVGRAVREKGLGVLAEAWRLTGLDASTAALVLVGEEPLPPWAPAGGAVTAVGRRTASEIRNFYAGADVVVMPSIPTRTFREPWGLVANEAMNQRRPVIASDAVGAAAGGLIRDQRNGLIVAAGDGRELADAILRLAADRDMGARLGAAGAIDVGAYTHEAWASGFAGALRSVAA